MRASAPGWVGGVLAGLQAALFSFALVLIPVWVVTASAEHATVSWSDATTTATRMWLLGFAVPWSVEGVAFTLVPLGLPAVTMLMISQLVRRFASATWVAGSACVVSFMAMVGFLAATAWEGEPLVGARVLRALAVAGALAIPATAWGLMRRHGAQLMWVSSIRPEVLSGARTAVALVAGVLAMASIVLVVTGLSHGHRIADAATGLGVDAAGGLALAAGSMLYAPNLVLWVAAWLSGAGYGAGQALQTASSGVSGLPTVPLLEALPGTAASALLGPVVLVAFGATVHLALVRRRKPSLAFLAGDLVGVAVAAAILSVGVRASQGGIGPGSLAHIGAPALATGALACAWLGAGTTLAWAGRKAALTWLPTIRRSESVVQTSHTRRPQGQRHTVSSPSA